MAEKRYALLVDIDNVNITREALIGILRAYPINYGKVYGYAERKHREFLEVINTYSLENCTTMRCKKRISQLDVRMVIDAVNMALTNNAVDAFILVGGNADFAPLITFLKAHGKYVVGAFESPLNNEFCDEVMDIKSESLNVAKAVRPAAPKAERIIPAARPVVEEEDEDEGGEDIFSELEKIVKDFASKNN